MYSIDFKCLEEIPYQWDFSFVGTHSDERDVATKQFLDDKTSQTHVISYDSEEMVLHIDSEIIEIHELLYNFKKFKGKKVIVDATSMSVAEMFLLIKQLYGAKVRNIEVIYSEPIEYTKGDDNNFILSDAGIGFSGSGIPSITYSQTDNSHILFLLGYEGDRFADALEVLQPQPEQVSLMFGVPSYKLNWEKNSYKGNLRVIADNQLTKRFEFAGANNSKSVEKKIKEIYNLCRQHDQQLILVPVGTKPQAIAALSVLCECEDGEVSVMWDQPTRKRGRTKGISTITITKDIFDV